MNDNEQTLLKNLHGLAQDGLQEAPAHVEERLLTEFRRRARARAVKTWSAIGATAAIAAGLAVMLWVRPAPRHAAQPVAQNAAPEVQDPAVAPDQAAMSFYRLPQADELPPVENATVVRVQLTMSSLRLIGFPVNEARAAERVQADVLVGQDGLARGVRFVQ